MKRNDKKVVICRLCSNFERKPIQLEFKGRSMDFAISKMKRDSHMVLNYHDRMLLECCLLFLCGFSFSEIGNQLHIYDKVVVKFLRDKRIKELLSDEYYFLFQKNKYRLVPKTGQNSKIKKVVKTFIEQNGDVSKTCNILGISEVSFHNYISHQNLEQIVNDSNLYFNFLMVSDNKVGHVQVKSDTDQKLLNDLMLLKPKNVIEQKYLKLAKAILVQKIYDIDEIVKHTELSRASVVSYLEDFSRCEQFFPGYILEKLKKDGFLILHRGNKQVTFDEFAKKFISFYMSSRYSYNDIKDIFKITKNKVKYILNDYAKEILNEEEYKELEKHRDKISIVTMSCPLAYFLIKDPKMIRLVKPNMAYTGEYHYRLLNTVVSFLDIYQELYSHDIDQTLDIKVQFLFSNMKQLEEILNYESFTYIKRCLEIEELLTGNRLREKSQFILSTVKQFLIYDMNLTCTSEKLDIPVPTLIRILQDPYISISYGPVLNEYIKSSIQHYRLEYEKNKDHVNHKKSKKIKQKKTKQV